MKKLPFPFKVPLGIFFRDTRMCVLATELFKRPLFSKYEVTILDISAYPASIGPDFRFLCKFKIGDRDHDVTILHKKKFWKFKYELELFEDIVANIIEYVEREKND